MVERKVWFVVTTCYDWSAEAERLFSPIRATFPDMPVECVDTTEKKFGVVGLFAAVGGDTKLVAFVNECLQRMVTN